MDRKAENRRLLRLYGITLEVRERMDKVFDGACWVCRRQPKPGGKRLHVDHDHAYRWFKVRTTKLLGGSWSACIPEINVTCVAVRKADAVRDARNICKTKSVRGLCCWSCNAGLRKFRDSAERLQNAAEYIRESAKRMEKILNG